MKISVKRTLDVLRFIKAVVVLSSARNVVKCLS
jgi:hypothetical protein